MLHIFIMKSHKENRKKTFKQKKKPNYELQPTNTVDQRPHQVIVKLAQTESTIMDADQL